MFSGAQNASQRPPRMRGGCPRMVADLDADAVSAPHARGLSPEGVVGGENQSVRPACAGVVPSRTSSRTERVSPPRMRGGCPPLVEDLDSIDPSAPHARGLSRPIPLFRRVAVGPPRMRGGCPRVTRIVATKRSVRPACAGVVPRRSARRRPAGRSAPHARGLSLVNVASRGVPGVVPACAGVVPTPAQPCPRRVRRPRMRGGCPKVATSGKVQGESFPHVRGLSHAKGHPRSDDHVFPACAGVGHSPSPSTMSVRPSSPHVREFSGRSQQQAHRRHIFPACAGLSRTVTCKDGDLAVLSACAGVVPWTTV